MNSFQSLMSGAVGASILTAAHEALRHARPQDAPRMDILGERAINKGMEMVGQDPLREDKLYLPTLAGDLLSNAAYYSLVGAGDEGNIWLRGAALGAAAGLGALVLPGPMGLGEAPSKRTPQTAMMTVGLYMLGGLAAAATASLFIKESEL
ncbi:MAG TPA: hypothetical protein VEC36_12240 [Patescibacteria group bacterium]|nr:hypothetical protein [Patescibacteria group bacterium]